MKRSEVELASGRSTLRRATGYDNECNFQRRRVNE